MNELIDKIFEKLTLQSKYQKSAKYKLEQLVKEYDNIEIEDSVHNYIQSEDKPEFWKWFNDWKRYRTNMKAYKDDRPVSIMNDVMKDMEHRLQFYIDNKDLHKYQKIKNHEELSSKLEYFVIEKSGAIDMRASYIQQFYDFIYEKITEKIKPELWKIVENVGIENIIGVYLKDKYYDMMNWKKSVSDLMDYPMNDIIESVLETRFLKIDFINEAINKIIGGLK
jgi:hypothetical protein